jgi:hypothetical protein
LLRQPARFVKNEMPDREMPARGYCYTGMAVPPIGASAALRLPRPRKRLLGLRSSRGQRMRHNCLLGATPNMADCYEADAPALSGGPVFKVLPDEQYPMLETWADMHANASVSAIRPSRARFEAARARGLSLRWSPPVLLGPGCGWDAGLLRFA